MTLRLQPRHSFERVVEVRGIDGLIEAFDARIADGFLFGDFQFATDPDARDVPAGRRVLVLPARGRRRRRDTRRSAGARRWTTGATAAYLAHADKGRAFEMYARHYLATDGQLYWSDTHQLARLPRRLPRRARRARSARRTRPPR